MEKRPASNTGQEKSGLQPANINKGLQPGKAPSVSRPPSGGSGVKKP